MVSSSISINRLAAAPLVRPYSVICFLSILTSNSNLEAGIFTSDSFSKYSGLNISSSSPISKTLSTLVYFKASSTILATFRFMVSASGTSVPLILRTKPAIAIKHCAKADSSSLKYPDGWHMSYAIRIRLTTFKKYVLKDTFFTFLPSSEAKFN